MTKLSWEKVSHKQLRSSRSSIRKLPEEWEWETVSTGPSYTSYGRGTVGKILPERVFDCAFCRGKGQKPAGSLCPVCRGQGTVTIDPPAVMCAYCRGRGQEKPRSNITCTCCKGRGILRVTEPIEICPHCNGRGAEPTNKLPCGKCHGSGVVTIKNEVRLPEDYQNPRKWEILPANKDSIEGKKPPRFVHKPSGSELEVTEIILERGPIGAWKIGRAIGISANYAGMVCRSLRERGLIELCEGRAFTGTSLGRKVMGPDKEKETP